MTVCGNSVSGVCSKCQYVNVCNKGVFDKSPYKPKTNEEWLNGLDTEGKAQFLSVEAARAISEYETGKVARTGVSFWEWWLKSEHKE